jgi:serine/threonine protein kinase
MDSFYQEIQDYSEAQFQHTELYALDHAAIEVAKEQQNKKILETVDVLTVNSDTQRDYYLSRNTINTNPIFTELLSYPQISAAASVVAGITTNYTDLDNSSNIHRLLKNVHQMNSGGFGYVLRAGVDETDPAFVIKIAKDREDVDPDSIQHEIYIGLCVANQFIADGIPNYVSCFGYFLCSPPTLEPTQETVLEYCPPGDKKIPYCIYEYVEGPTMTKYCETANAAGVLSAYLQILLALRNRNFTHYDLHSDNVLMRPVETCQIRYSFADADYFVCLDSVSTMIDYGTCVYQGDVIDGGTFEDESWRAHRHRSTVFPIYDAYSLLMSIASRPLINGKSNIEIYQGIFDFFFPGVNIGEAIAAEWQQDFVNKSYYRLPLIPKYMSLQLNDLITHVITKCRGSEVCSINHPYEMPYYTPSTQTFTELTTAAGVTPEIHIPETIFEFYDLYQYLVREQPNDIAEIREHFDYATAAAAQKQNLFALMYEIIAIQWPTYGVTQAENIQLLFTTIIQYRQLVDKVKNYVQVNRDVDTILEQTTLTAHADESTQFLTTANTNLCTKTKECLTMIAAIPSLRFRQRYREAVKTLEYLQKTNC